MKSKQKLVLILISIIICFLLPTNFIKPQNKNVEPDIHPSVNGIYGATLQYKGYFFHSFTLDQRFGIDWYFKSHNPDIGVKVLVMTKSNYLKFILNSSNFDHYLVSDGTYTLDKGHFGVPYEGDWYLVFLNDDPDMESTEFDRTIGISANPNLFFIFPIILILSIFIGIGIISLIYKTRRRKVPDGIFFFLCTMTVLTLFYFMYGPTLINAIYYEGIKYPKNETLGIWINSEDDYEKYGIPGSGTAEDPYIIENMTILTSSSSAIDIEYSSDYVVIRNNILSSSYRAISIYSLNSSYIKIVNNTCIGSRSIPNGYCIDLFTRKKCLGTRIISDNTIINYREGIYVTNSPNSIIQNNILNNVQIGIEISHSEKTAILNNKISFKDSDFYDVYDAIRVTSANCRIENNSLIGSGLYLSNSVLTNVIVEDNKVNGKKLAFFKNMNNINLTDSDIYGQIFLVNCNNITLRNQNLSNVNYALNLFNCNNSRISNIGLNNNLNRAFQMFYCTNVNVTNCVLKNNLEGAYVYESDLIDFYHNLFYYNNYGISIYFSNCSYTSNFFINNTVKWRVFTS
jgi:parallel beta-helix repeat protein